MATFRSLESAEDWARTHPESRETYALSLSHASVSACIGPAELHVIRSGGAALWRLGDSFRLAAD